MGGKTSQVQPLPPSYLGFGGLEGVVFILTWLLHFILDC